MSAGKGDKYRRVNKKKYDDNYSQIVWKSNKKEKNESICKKRSI